MNAEYISYQSLVAAREAANWALGTLIATAISTLATVITLIFAYRALSTWRDQEKTRVKLEYRNSIAKLKSALMFMPLDFDPIELEEEREQVIAKWLFKDDDLILQQMELGEQNVHKFDELQIAYDNCNSAWLATEHLFDDSEDADRWFALKVSFENYVSGKESKLNLIQSIIDVNVSRFVFNSR